MNRKEWSRRNREIEREFRRRAIERSPKGWRRRRVLRNLAIILGGGIGLGLMSGTEGKMSSNATESLTPTPVEFDTFQMQHNTLNVVISEHNDIDWEPNKQAITNAIDVSEYMIPEYYTPEYDQLAQSGDIIGEYVAAYNKVNGLFNEVAKICIEKRKPIWVVDPMYNREGAKLRIALQTPSIFGLPLAAMFATDTFIEAMNERMSRRRIIFGTAAAATALISPIPTNEIGMDIERDFRRVMSAELLERVDERIASQNPDSPTRKNLTMIIPKAHWDKIKYYLSPDGKQDRQDRLTKYRAIFGELFPSLFEARYHAPGDTSGNPKETISLLN